METMLKKKAYELRKKVLDVFEKGRKGHIASSFSSVEIMTALYYGGILHFRPEDPQWDGRDRFILSKGHAAILYYTILSDVGYFDDKVLMSYGQQGNMLGVHVDPHVPGVEAISGSLACGLGLAAGMAMAAKMDQKEHMVFSLLGDGECYEGAIWEAAAFAAHNRLNNLVVIVDHNHMCCGGFLEDTVSMEPFEEKWEAFGFHVVRVNGHDIEQLIEVLRGARCRKFTKPLCVVADTVKAKGLPHIENTVFCHGYAPNSVEKLQMARNLLKEGE